MLDVRGLVVASGLVVVLAGCGGGADVSTAPGDPDSDSGTEVSQMQDMAQELGITDPPSVTVVREITPSESRTVLNSCLSEAGWELTQEGSGAAAYDISPDQEDAFNLAYYTCVAQYPVEAKYSEPYTDEQFGILYDHWTDTTIPCLEGLGYEVRDVPSRQTFIENPTWLPQPGITDAVSADVSAGRWQSWDQVFEEECPVDPPEDVLYGS